MSFGPQPGGLLHAPVSVVHFCPELHWSVEAHALAPMVGGGGVGTVFVGGGACTGGAFTGGAFAGGGAGAVAEEGGGSAPSGEGAGSGRLHAAIANKAAPKNNVRIASRIAEHETNRNRSFKPNEVRE